MTCVEMFGVLDNVKKSLRPFYLRQKIGYYITLSAHLDTKRGQYKNSTFIISSSEIRKFIEDTIPQTKWKIADAIMTDLCKADFQFDDGVAILEVRNEELGLDYKIQFSLFLRDNSAVC